MNRKDRRQAAKVGAREAPKPLARPAPGAQRLLESAVALHRQGRLDEAELLFRQLLAAKPDEPDALHFLGLIAIQRGQPEAATALIARAIAIDGKVAAYHSNLGEAYRQQARNLEAIPHYRRALALQPQGLAARFGLGTSLLDEKAHAEAATELEIVVRADPGDVHARINLGNALSELGRTDEAIAHYRAASEVDPAYAEIQVNLGNAFEAKGDLREAARSFARAADLAPQLAEAHYGLGRMLNLLERHEDATAALRRAQALKPDDQQTMLMLGRILCEQHKAEEAIPWFERAAALAPTAVEPLICMGAAYLELNRFEEARGWFDRALAREPQSADALYNIGLGLQRLGRFDEAATWHEKAIAADSSHSGAHFHLALNRRHGSIDDKVRQIEAALALPTLTREQRSGLNFALAKAYDDVGDYETAFAYYRTGNEAKKQGTYFKPEDFARYVDRAIASFPASLFARLGQIGSASELPVFIVGMPRSGTTLVEQIISSHPSVFGAGELDHIRQIARALPAALGADEPYPESIHRLDGATAGRLAGEHVARLAAMAPGALRVSDKLPNNFQRLGLIALLFPKARIIHCRRDPIDTCLSCYFQEFAHGQPYSYDLGHLGHYYRQYERIMEHWRSVLPSPIFEIPYEELIADQEGWSRRLIAHLGLPWDERCLAFHRNERQVHTASFWQVRQPIYASSVQRWRHYARHLGPLFEALGIDPPPE